MIGYVADRVIWIFVGIVIAISTTWFDFLAVPNA
jgi:hypothetical protein